MISPHFESFIRSQIISLFIFAISSSFLHRHRRTPLVFTSHVADFRSSGSRPFLPSFLFRLKHHFCRCVSYHIISHRPLIRFSDEGLPYSAAKKKMVLTNFTGTGVGFGFGVGCGFGVGWGFGGLPINVLGLGAGGGCGVGVGLGWGFGNAFGSQYQTVGVTFQGIDINNNNNNNNNSEVQHEVKNSGGMTKSSGGVHASKQVKY